MNYNAHKIYIHIMSLLTTKFYGNSVKQFKRGCTNENRMDWLTDLKTMDSLNATMTEQNLNNYDTLLNSDHLDLPY